MTPMNSSVKLSIIIPIYNAYPYISECLASIAKQKSADMEVILVDDGSTDNSKSVCESYAQKDKRFIYTQQQNAGASSARNKGLALARGEWISFIDADDWISDDYFKIFDMQTSDSDLIFFGAKVFEIKGDCRNVILDAISNTSNAESQHTIMSLRNSRFGNVFGWTWNKFFKSKLIKEHCIRFKENLSFFEDEIFTLEYCRHINSICVLDQQLYFYRKLETGLTSKGGNMDMIQIADLLKENMQYYTDEDLKESLLTSITRYYAEDIYKHPVREIYSRLKTYVNLIAEYPQSGKKFKVNNLSKYVNVSFWFGYVYCLIRKL